MIKEIRIATRQSRLALWQTEYVADTLRRAHPGIEIEIVASNEMRDLRRREADIAIRPTSRPPARGQNQRPAMALPRKVSPSRNLRQLLRSHRHPTTHWNLSPHAWVTWTSWRRPGLSGS